MCSSKADDKIKNQKKNNNEKYSYYHPEEKQCYLVLFLSLSFLVF